MKPAGGKSSGLLNQPCGVETHVGLDGSNTSILLTLQCDALKKQVVIMSFQAMAWAVKQRLTCQEKMVLLMLANYADQAGRCYPSMKVLSEECGLSLAQTRKCIAKLEEAKLVRRYKRIRSYGQTSNSFILAIEDPHSNRAPPHSNRVP